MVLGVPGYIVPHVRVRAMIGRLLSDGDWADLDRARTMADFVQRLRETGYGERLAGIDPLELSCEVIEARLSADTVAAYYRVERLLPSPDDELVHLLRQFYEVDNIKTVLRGVAIGEDREKLRSFLVPPGEGAESVAVSLLDANDVQEVIERARGTVFGPALVQALPRYEAENRLFAIEVALDLDYYRRLWRSVEALRGSSKEWALRIIGPWYDQTNVIWALRYKHYHDLSVPEIINYTLPYGHRCTDAHIRAIARGEDVGDVIAQIWGRRAPKVDMNEDRWLPRLEARLHRLLAETARLALAGYPFHLGVALGFILLKHYEIRDLMVLAEAKTAAVPRATYYPYMVHEFRRMVVSRA